MSLVELLDQGATPSDVRVAPLFSVANEVHSANRGLREPNLLSLSYGRIVRKDIHTSEGLLPESFEGYQIVEDGDTVLRLTDLQNDQRSLRTGLAHERGIITSAYLALRPVNTDARFLSYVLHGYDVCKAFYSMGGGMRQSLKFDDLKRLPIPSPPLEEQRRIADYLDDTTTRIDNIITARQQQIGLLQEEQRSWAAGRFEGAKAAPIRRMLQEAVVGIVVKPSDWYTDADDGVPALRGTDVHEFAISPYGQIRISPQGHALHPRSRLSQGDVVVVRTGDAGAACVVPDWAEGWNAIDLVIARGNPSVIPEYLEFLLNAARWGAHVGAAASGSIQQHFGVGALLDLSVPTRSLVEQKELVAEFRELRQHAAMASTSLEDSVLLLRELKRSLISAAVSGEFDVSSADGSLVVA